MPLKKNQLFSSYYQLCNSFLILCNQILNKLAQNTQILPAQHFFFPINIIPKVAINCLIFKTYN